jgi:hypothetical protein
VNLNGIQKHVCTWDSVDFRPFTLNLDILDIGLDLNRASSGYPGESHRREQKKL